jgi:hypothetical protein
MRAILIDPFARSVEYVEILSGDGPEGLMETYRLVGENGIDTCFPFSDPGEFVIVGDHSALHAPPWPHFRISGYHGWLYGKALVCGRTRGGATRDTHLRVEQVHELVEFL